MNGDACVDKDGEYTLSGGSLTHISERCSSLFEGKLFEGEAQDGNAL